MPCGGMWKACMTAATVPLYLDLWVFEELRDELTPSHSEGSIRQLVKAALTDLQGSISREALPEMAVRLVRARTAQN